MICFGVNLISNFFGPSCCPLAGEPKLNNFSVAVTIVFQFQRNEALVAAGFGDNS